MAEVRDRLVFQNGVLLIGPVTVTPEIERRAGLPGPGQYPGALRIDEEAAEAYTRDNAGREVCLKVGNAALALAGESGGIALDVLGFIINSADDLLPRPR